MGRELQRPESSLFSRFSDALVRMVLACFRWRSGQPRTKPAVPGHGSLLESPPRTATAGVNERPEADAYIAPPKPAVPAAEAPTDPDTDGRGDSALPTGAIPERHSDLSASSRPDDEDDQTLSALPPGESAEPNLKCETAQTSEEQKVGQGLRTTICDVADSPDNALSDAVELGAEPGDTQVIAEKATEENGEVANSSTCDDATADDTAEIVDTGHPPLTSDHADTQRSAPKYRPRLRERSNTSAHTRPTPDSGAGSSAPGTLQAELLLTFQPGGWGISLSVLLRRAEAMAEEMTVRLADETLDLAALDDQLFEPVLLNDARSALTGGFVAESAGSAPRRWVRTVRRLHVFSGRTGVPGFSTAPRALIGQENVILCETELANRVVECCVATGSGPPVEVIGPGIPVGWTCFREYRPRTPSDWRDADDIFLALNPLPDAVIELVGGISLSRTVWVAGRPPSIRILGTDPAPGEVTIDGGIAELVNLDQWVAPGWDSSSQHVIRYAGLSRSYEIVEPLENWSAWLAHGRPDFAMTGALTAGWSGRPLIVLPGSAYWLLGARPGELAWAGAAPGGLVASASPAFTPVWAIPPASGRRRPVPRLLDVLDEPQDVCCEVPLDVRRWCRLVRNAAPTPIAHGLERQAHALWRLYLAAARSLRRRSR